MNTDEISKLSETYSWFLSPIKRAVNHIEDMPFFKWLNKINHAKEFKGVANQIYYHSVSLPRVLGLMLSMVPSERGVVYQVLSEHAYEEADHHLLLLDWMMTNKLLKNATEITQVLPTVETCSCINIAYEIAFSRDCDLWLTCMNSSIELCFYKFFCASSKKMHELGVGHKYFDVHVEGDAYHSIMGLKYLSDFEPNSERTKFLLAKSLQAVTLWASMVHSWIGIEMLPKFNLDGSLTIASLDKCSSIEI